MISKFTALAAASALVSATSAYGVALMYNTHAHMERVRGDSYMNMPFTMRLGYNVDASWQRFKMRAASNPVGEEAALNKATYGLPCLTPVVKP